MAPGETARIQLSRATRNRTRRLRPAWIQMSLHIRVVSSGSILFAIRPYKFYRNFIRTVSMDHDETARMCGLMLIHAGRKHTMLVFLCCGWIISNILYLRLFNVFRFRQSRFILCKFGSSVGVIMQNCTCDPCRELVCLKKKFAKQKICWYLNVYNLPATSKY